MMLTKTIAKDLKDNWDDIKSKIKRHWSKLSANDLEEIEGSYAQLIKKVEDAYEIKKDEATEKVHDYIAKLGLSEMSEKTLETQETLADKAKTAKEKFEKSIRDSIAKIKDSTENVHEDISEYVKINPLKSVGIAILAGLVTGKLWHIAK